MNKLMQMVIPCCVMVVVALFGTGCNIAGPAYPEKNGRAFLESKGVASAEIDRIVRGGRLTPEQVDQWEHCRSTDVRFLVARNAYLDPALIEGFIRDRDDFVRSGAACNPRLSAAQMEVLLADRSHTVYSALAGNPEVPEAVLLRLRQERGLGLIWFAMNPNCPERLRTEIAQSGDADARYWLKVVAEQWIPSGVFARGDDGRWHQPAPLP